MKDRGFTLFIAITLMATLLLIAAGIVALAVKQSLISSSGRESQHAFYAADTGIECALYWDIQNPSGRSAFSIITGSEINCNNQTATVGGSSLSTFSLNFLPDPYCAVVTVTKSGGAEGIPSSQTFNSSTSWTAPAGVTSVTVEAWGGGGGGGERNGLNGGGGGGGGAYSRKVVTVTPDTNYPVTVGGGGAGAPQGTNPATNGGDSWFIDTSTVLAKGGSGGSRPSGGAGGASGSGVGDTKFSGGTGGNGTPEGGGGGGGGSALETGNGSNGSNAVTFVGGAGGSGKGAGGSGGNSASWPDAASGTAPGGGGGAAGQGFYNGASGAAGRVVLTYTPYAESGGTTTIESRGYNTCDLSNPRRVERAVRAIY